MARRSGLKRLLSAPLPLIASKVLQKGAQRMSLRKAEAQSRKTDTYGVEDSPNLARWLRRHDWLPETEPHWLPNALEAILKHEFDLLGSGPTVVTYGAVCRGFLGNHYDHRFERRDSYRPQVGDLPAGSLSSAQRIWDMIDSEYAPIDWQLDFRSGYRWNAGTFHQRIAIGKAPGADIKVPWELGRLQHLPILALGYALGSPDSESRYLAEFQNQVLDFQAWNPPEWGVQWRCAMDVGIRIANVLLAREMFFSAGAAWDDKFEAELARMARSHARFIVENLEWSPHHTGNHFLANVAGLLFAAACLESTPETDAWLAFSIQEFVAECRKQFLPDGGNYEGSTSYHRLSGEMAAWCCALLLGLPEERLQSLNRSHAESWKRKPALNPGPTPLYHPFGTYQQTPVPKDVLELIGHIGAFSEALTKPDGAVVQIGDNDSGRFIRIEDPSIPVLNHTAFVELTATLSGKLRNAPNDVAARIVRSITDSMLPNSQLAPRPVLESDLQGPQALKALLDLADQAPAGRREEYEWDLGPAAWEGLLLESFPDFGVYVFRSEQTFLSVRSGRADHDGRGGHSHNDALAMELWHNGDSLIADPGTFVYTPDPTMRDLYRSVKAHCVPHLDGLEPNPLEVGMFFLPDRSKASMIAFCDQGFAGCHLGYGEAVYRVVLLISSGLRVIDFFHGPGKRRLQREAFDQGRFLSPVPFSPGYGVQDKP